MLVQVELRQNFILVASNIWKYIHGVYLWNNMLMMSDINHEHRS